MLYKAFISYSHAADARLAPALRSALRRIGAPWYRRAPFRIFLDESSMSANPALWDAIEAALGQSEYLLLLASAGSARSEWVERELNWWLTHRGASSILILVTDGDIEWPPGAKDFDWEHTTALSHRLCGQFSEEPLWVDLLWARAERKFSLRREKFRNAVLQIAPPLYGKSREDLDDEDTRHYRAARRLAVIASFLLAALMIGVGVAARNARVERSAADCRQIAGQAAGYLDSRLDVALLLGVEGSRRSSCVEGRSALLTALQHCPHFGGFLSGHTDMVTNLAYAPDGRTLASSSWDGSVRLWNLETRKMQGAPLKGMYGLSFSPDGSRLVSAGGDFVKLWKLPEGTPAGELKFDKRYLMSRATFSPDGKIIATSNEPSGTVPSTLFLWDAATLQPLGQTIPARVFAFSPDGKLLATEGEDGKSIVLRDMRTHLPVGPPLADHAAPVRAITFSGDGQLLAAGRTDNSVIVWDLQDRRSPGTVLTGHRAPVNAVAFSPTENVLASGSGDGSVILWDLEKLAPVGAALTVAEKPVFDIAFSPDGRTLVSTTEERVAVWNLHEELSITHALEMQNQPESGLAFSPDGNTLASIDGYGEITLSDINSGRVLQDSIGDKLTAVAFSPDGSQFASVGWKGQLQFWDSKTGDPKGPAQDTGFRLFSAAFSADGRTLAMGGDSVVLLWDIPGRRPIARIVGRQKDRIWSVVFSPDGKLLASGGNASFALWDAKTGAAVLEPVSVDKNPQYVIHADVAFRDGGNLLVYRKGEAGVAFWNIARRREEAVLSGQREVVSALGFSPDGKLMATGASNGAVVMWDVPTSQAIGQPLTGMGTEIESLAFRPKGRMLAALGDKHLLLWDFDEQSWRDTACRLANRNLTRDEWVRFFGPAAAYRETCAAAK